MKFDMLLCVHNLQLYFNYIKNTFLFRRFLSIARIKFTCGMGGPHAPFILIEFYVVICAASLPTHLNNKSSIV